MDIKKSAKIDYKVLSKSDLNKIIRYFITVKEELDNENTNVRFKIDFEDGSSIRGVDASILEETETKTVEFIHFSLTNFRLQNEMSLFLSTTKGSYEVESKDRNWVDAKFSQIEDIFKVIPNQNYWFSNIIRQTIIINSVGIIIGIIMLYFFRKILGTDISSFAIIFFSIAVGQITSYLLVGRMLEKLYPIIDFDTILEYINTKKKKKMVVKNIFMVIVIPLIITILAKFL